MQERYNNIVTEYPTPKCIVCGKNDATITGNNTSCDIKYCPRCWAKKMNSMPRNEREWANAKFTCCGESYVQAF